jgi:aminopeptidase N
MITRRDVFHDVLKPVWAVTAAWFLASAAPAAVTAPASARLLLPTAVSPLHYRLEITPDAQALSFSGTLQIEVAVHQRVDTVVLNSADIVIDHADTASGAGAIATTYDAEAQTVSLKMDRPLAPGTDTLRVSYHGKIFKSPAGLFALDYPTDQGEARALFTQFEAGDARRFLPCWDEPARKATFELIANVPKDEVAVSNMPIAASEPHGALTQVRFARTPKMSSYLLFFALGNFTRVHRDVGGVDVGVIATRGNEARARYALDAAAQILPYYNEYFGVHFPLPKLDLIAAPGTSQTFGAMENWGAIMSFARALLIDPKTSSEADRRRVYIVTAHEMAHQWFGDLVTMDWWDDLWLNEGFASWTENRVTDHFHPEWKVWLSDEAPRIEEAMSLDERVGTHPIVTHIRSVQQASSGSFDRITYSKGAAVIRMLEAYAGEERFRDGVRRYMARYAYGNAVSDDLWREVDRNSQQPIMQIARDFTLQAGVPMINEAAMSCHGGSTRVELTQTHFAIDRNSTQSREWHVPVGSALANGASRSQIIRGPAPQSITLPGCGTLILNAGHTAYFRSHYSQQGLAAVTQAFATLSPEDEFWLLSDGFEFASTGEMPMGAVLDIAARVPADADATVTAKQVDILNMLDHLYDGLPAQVQYRRFAIRTLRPLYERLGWEPRPGESANSPLVRADVIVALARFGDDSVITEARTRFDRLERDPQGLSPDLRSLVLRAVAISADGAVWERLHAMAKSSDSQLERSRFYNLLSSAQDPKLAERALELAISGEPPATSSAEMVRFVSEQHPALAVNFAVAHWAQFLPILEPNARPRYLARLGADADDPAVIDTLERFAAEHVPPDQRQSLIKTESNIRYRAEIRAKRLPEVSAWVERHEGAGGAVAGAE